MSTKDSAREPVGESENPVDSKRELAEMIKVFAQCMEASRGSDEERGLACQCNRLLDEYLGKYPDESIAAIAFNLHQLGVPYEDAFRDVMYVRQFGVRS